MNHIETTTFLVPGVSTSKNINDLTPQESVIGVVFFDGLGRLVQSVSIGQSPAMKDMVIPVMYDEFGRQANQFLPYTRDVRDGGYVVGAISEQYNFYQQGATNPIDTHPFSKTIFETSPLNRVLQQGAPGASWQPDDNDPKSPTSKVIKKSYQFNKENEVFYFSYDATSGAVVLGNSDYYEANALYANNTYDEINNLLIEFVDKEGRIICKKNQSGGTQTLPVFACTYYIYDDYGNLVLVLPPEGVEKVKTLLNLN